jgi:hypothetical protein
MFVGEVKNRKKNDLDDGGNTLGKLGDEYVYEGF